MRRRKKVKANSTATQQINKDRSQQSICARLFSESEEFPLTQTEWKWVKKRIKSVTNAGFPTGDVSDGAGRVFLRIVQAPSPSQDNARAFFTSWMASVASLTTHRLILERNFTPALLCILTVSFTWGTTPWNRRERIITWTNSGRNYRRKTSKLWLFSLILCLSRYKLLFLWYLVYNTASIY